jgi:hypothetical protein
MFFNLKDKRRKENEEEDRTDKIWKSENWRKEEYGKGREK